MAPLCPQTSELKSTGSEGGENANDFLICDLIKFISTIKLQKLAPGRYIAAYKVDGLRAVGVKKGNLGQIVFV